MDDRENKLGIDASAPLEENNTTPPAPQTASPVNLTVDPVAEEAVAQAEAAVKRAELEAEAAAQKLREDNARAAAEAARVARQQAAEAEEKARQATGSFYGYAEPPHAPEPPAYGGQPQQPNTSQYQAPEYHQAPQNNQQPYPYTSYPSYNQQTVQYPQAPMGYIQKSRLAAGILGILFGGLGVHNYYLGFHSKATVQLIVCLAGGLVTCGLASVAMSIWGLVEGIMILSGNPNRLYDGNGVILKD